MFASLTGRLTVIAALFCAPLATADAIRLDGEWLEDVYLDITETVVFIRIPETGHVRSVLADGVSEDDIRVSDDPAAREALKSRWRAARDARDDVRQPVTPSDTAPLPRPQPAPRASAAPSIVIGPSVDGETVARIREGWRPEYVTDGMVDQINLRDVPLDQALKALLRPLNLDYEMRGNIVYISTPERLRTEGWGESEARVYQVKGMTDTLPKIIVRNTGGLGAVSPVGGTGVNGTGQNGGGFPQAGNGTGIVP